MERILQRRLERIIENNDILIGEQSGYRKKKGTTDSLIIMKEFINKANSEGKISVAVYLDLEGAYDSIWHEGLIQKLIKLNIGKTYINWIISYLQKRTQTVRIGSKESDEITVSCGLPQGAVLSPMLFNIMLSDIPKDDNVQLIIYADDITLLSKGNNSKRN